MSTPSPLDYAKPSASSDPLRQARLLHRWKILSRFRWPIFAIVIAAFLIGFHSPTRSPLRGSATLVLIGCLGLYVILAAIASSRSALAVVSQLVWSLVIALSGLFSIAGLLDAVEGRNQGLACCSATALALAAAGWHVNYRAAFPNTPTDESPASSSPATSPSRTGTSPTSAPTPASPGSPTSPP